MILGIPVAANSNTIPTASTADEAVLHGLKPVMVQQLGLTLGLTSLPKPATLLSHQALSLNEATAPYRERGAMVTRMPTTTDCDSTMITRSANDVRRLMPHTGKSV
jgi:hypothetical protein